MSASLADSDVLPVVSDTQRRAALVQAEIGSWFWDFPHDHFSLDPAWCSHLGLDPCSGRDHLERWARNIHPDDVFEFHRVLEAVRGGASDRFEGEYRILTEDSRWLWLLHRGHVLERAADGKALRLCGICIEIDLRKQADVAVQENEARLATALWGARAAFWQWQIAANVMQMSPLWFAMTGYTREQWEAASDPWFSRIHPDDRDRVEQQMRADLLSQQSTVDVEYRIRTGNGRWKWMLTRGRAVAWDFEGNATTAIGISLDIHARKESAQGDALRTQSWILETMREGVLLVDSASSIIRLVNPALDRMFGYGPGELLGRSALPLFMMPPVQRERVERGLRQGDAEPVAIQPVEFECERRDGSRFVVSCVITPLRMSGAEHWLAVLNDVTERKRLEREIIEIANREQQRIGSDLHDGLGQELTGIALMLRSLAVPLQKQNPALKGEVDDVIGLVNNAIQTSRSLARGLSPVNAQRGGLAEALQTLAAKVAGRYGILVTFKGECDGASLGLDENAATHLYRIAQEAITNTARHSGATEVTIRIGRAGAGGGLLQLSVDDNGRGFDEQVADGSDGLGLKIMRYRAQMLGGDLVLESSASGGTSVRCVFPLP